MKTIIASLVLVLASATAHANAKIDQQSYCFNYASMFKSIAAWRDQGVSPEKTLALMRGVKGIPMQDKKDAVHSAYFDKSLANVRGAELENQVRSKCFADIPK